MFDFAKRIWREVRRLFDYTTLKTALGRELTLSQSMVEALESWGGMMDGKAPWCVDPVVSLRIESGICREFADAVLVEMESSILNNDRLDAAYQRGLLDLNENLQDGLGFGSFILRPLGADRTEFVTADKFVPVRFDDSGKPVDVAFLTVKRVGEYDYYTKMERHYFTNGNLTIENKCYHSLDRNHLGTPCRLDAVDEWADINQGPVTYPGMDRMDFGYYRNPLKNRIDGSFCGVSIFDAAADLIRKADIQAARLDWEYESGERAVHVDERALKRGSRGTRMAQLNKRLYRGLNIEDGKDKELLREYSPAMRDASYIAGLEKYYRNIEFTVGLAYGDLSDVQEVSKTATEVRVSKTRKYNRVTAIQENLKECLEDYAAALAFYNSMYHSGYEFACKFNDSILTDEDSERQQDRQDVSMGVMSAVEYRMKWYNEDEETAKKNLPVQNNVME